MSTTIITGTVRDGFANLFNGSIAVYVADQSAVVLTNITAGVLFVSIPVTAGSSVKCTARFTSLTKSLGVWHEQWTVFDCSTGMTREQALDARIFLAGQNTTLTTGQTTLTTAVAAREPLVLSINPQTGDYPLVAGDCGKVIKLTKGTGITLTVSAGLGAGFHCTIVQGGAGKVTPTAAGGVTLTQVDSHAQTKGAGSVAYLLATAANAFVLSGDLEAAG